jgi:hypothetical protein
VVEKVPDEKLEAPATPKVPLKVAFVALIAAKVIVPATESVPPNVAFPVTPNVELKVPVVADKAASVVAPVTPKVLPSVTAPVTPNVELKVPVVALKAARVEAPATDNVLESVVAAAPKVVNSAAAGVVPPIAGGAAKTGGRLDGMSEVFGFTSVPATASALVARNTNP